VTQVTAPEAGHAFHNRLSHSLKVAQVGRRNAERLQRMAEAGTIKGAAADLVNTLEPDAIEASCLAHDVGHPPFGHVSEKALHRAARETLGHDFDGFEGNAQSFRIVTRLAVRVGDVPGLDLTRRTLDGLLKYPWGFSVDPEEKAHRKWGYYQDDADAFRFVRPADDSSKKNSHERCLEAEIMDWADDLTYAVHDLDDFFRAGLIPLHRLGDPDSPESELLAEMLSEAKAAEPRAFPQYSISDLVAATQQALELYGPEVLYEHTATNRASMRKFGSDLITRYLEAFRVGVDAATGQAMLEINSDARCEVEALKLLVRVFVIRRPGLAVVQHGQKELITKLFNCYFEASADGEAGDSRLFPPEARERLLRSTTPVERGRVVVDLIAGLTEAGAMKLHQRLTGGATASKALDATADFG
jgi:dGTPase